MSNESVEIDFDHIEAETDMAWLVVIDDDEVWLPKSRCDIDNESHVADVPEWLAKEKGLI